MANHVLTDVAGNRTKMSNFISYRTNYKKATLKDENHKMEKIKDKNLCFPFNLYTFVWQ